MADSVCKLYRYLLFDREGVFSMVLKPHWLLCVSVQLQIFIVHPFDTIRITSYGFPLINYLKWQH